MARFRVKNRMVDATRWFKNGDHPLDYALDVLGLQDGELVTITGAECKAKGWEGQVVRYYRRPDVDGKGICPQCHKPMDYHGWIDSPDYVEVCPGDWVLTDELGYHTAMKPAVFNERYELEE